MNTFWESIINQYEAIERLKKLFCSELFPNALLFTGQKGIGKEAIATAFTQSLNCDKKTFYPCGVCSSCKAVRNLDQRFINFIIPLPKASNENDIDEPFEIFDDDNVNEILKESYQKKK